MQLDEPFGVVPLDVHQRIDAAVGLGEAREEVAHQVAVAQQVVEAVLQHRVGQHRLLARAVAGVEDADAVAQPAVEAVGTGIEHLENVMGVAQSVEQRLEKRRADGAGLVLENPFVFLAGEELPLALVVAEEIVEERVPVLLGDDQDRVVVAWAGHLDERLAVDQRLPGSGDIGVAELVLVEQLFELVEEQGRLGRREAAQLAAIETPDRLVAPTRLGVGVFLELLEQVVEKGTLAAAVRPFEDIDLVLLGAAAQRLHQGDEAVGEEPVGVEGGVDPLDEELRTVVIDVVDRLGIVGVFVVAAAHVALDHVVKDLKDVAHDDLRLVGHLAEEFVEGDRRVVLARLEVLIDVLQRLGDIVGLLGHIRSRLLRPAQSTCRVSSRLSMV